MNFKVSPLWIFSLFLSWSPWKLYFLCIDPSNKLLCSSNFVTCSRIPDTFTLPPRYSIDILYIRGFRFVLVKFNWFSITKKREPLIALIVKPGVKRSANKVNINPKWNLFLASEVKLSNVIIRQEGIASEILYPKNSFFF